MTSKQIVPAGARLASLTAGQQPMPGAAALASLAAKLGVLKPGALAQASLAAQSISKLSAMSAAMGESVTKQWSSVGAFSDIVSAMVPPPEFKQTILAHNLPLEAVSRAFKSYNLGYALLANNVAPTASAQFAQVVAGLKDLDLDTFARRPQTLDRPLPVVPAAAPTPVRDLDTFLRRIHPSLPEKRAGMYAAIDRADGVSQAACSGAELLRVMTNTLVPARRVWVYMRTIGEDVRGKRGRSRPPKEYHYELLALEHGLDPSHLAGLSLNGQLGSRFEDLKHDSYLMARADAKTQLLGLINQLEELLAFLLAALS